MPKVSIEHSLRRTLLLLLLLLGTLVVSVSYFGIRHMSLGIIEQRIDHDLESLISALNRDPAGNWVVEQAHLPLVYERIGSGHYYSIKVDSQEIVSRSLWDNNFPTKQLELGQEVQTEITQPSGEIWLARGVGIQKEESLVSVWIAEDVRDVLFDQRMVVGSLALILIATIVVAIYLQRKLIRRAFLRLDPIRQSFESGDLVSPVNRDQLPLEIQPLVQAIDSLLDRSKRQVERTRTSLGNLAHELKRPIQRLNWVADELSDNKSKQELEHLAAEFKRLTDRELKRARISGNPSPGTYFCPKDDLSTFPELFSRMYHKHIRFNSEYPDGKLPYDRDDMLELIGNLLDNAWRFADTQVSISIKVVGDGQDISIEIEDDGPGVSLEQIDLIKKRGVRIDEDEQVDSGSGLGIAISQSIVESYNGQLVFSRSSLGGLSVGAQLFRK